MADDKLCVFAKDCVCYRDPDVFANSVDQKKAVLVWTIEQFDWHTTNLCGEFQPFGYSALVIGHGNRWPIEPILKGQHQPHCRRCFETHALTLTMQGETGFLGLRLNAGGPVFLESAIFPAIQRVNHGNQFLMTHVWKDGVNMREDMYVFSPVLQFSEWLRSLEE